MRLLDIEGRVTVSDDKTNIPLPFRVGKDVKRLIVRYSYTPKLIENEKKANNILTAALCHYGVRSLGTSQFMPVKNLITLSFDENGSYRGACHRQPNEQTIIIADTDSTSGIINRPVQPGDWQAVLNVHYAGCDVDYRIEIDGEVEE